MKKRQVAILGGGLAGLTAAIHLSKYNISVLLFEKHAFPRHKVCGEYLSKEVLPYFQELDISLAELNPKEIHQLQYSSNTGKAIEVTLELGGLGISRFALDHFLYQKALGNGVEILQETIKSVKFEENQFLIKNSKGKEYTASIVLGAFGKRSVLDKALSRDFSQEKNTWLAMKMHYQESNFPDSRVALHNFPGGYCGLSRTETHAINLCFLTNYQTFKNYGNYDDFLENQLGKNPLLNEFLTNAHPLFERPISIAQFTFSPKKRVKEHLLMLGDAAGLIHPLCGNGMAMAIHSAKIASEIIIEEIGAKQLDREKMEAKYEKRWKNNFEKRMKAGRILQKILLNPSLSRLSQKVISRAPSLLSQIVQTTHGKPIA